MGEVKIKHKRNLVVLIRVDYFSVMYFSNNIATSRSTQGDVMHATDLKSQKLLDEYQTAFEEKHRELKTLLMPYAKQAVLASSRKRQSYLKGWLALLSLIERGADRGMAQLVNTPLSISLNGSEAFIWVSNPRFRKGGSRGDFIDLSCWVEGGHDEYHDFEFDMVVRIRPDGNILDVVLGAQLRWAYDDTLVRY